MRTIQNCLYLHTVNMQTQEVLFSPNPGKATLGEQLVTLTLQEWQAIGGPDVITTKVEPGDTRSPGGLVIGT